MKPNKRKGAYMKLVIQTEELSNAANDMNGDLRLQKTGQSDCVIPVAFLDNSESTPAWVDVSDTTDATTIKKVIKWLKKFSATFWGFFS